MVLPESERRRLIKKRHPEVASSFYAGLSGDTNPEKSALDFKRIFQVLRHDRVRNLTQNVKKSVICDIKTEKIRFTVLWDVQLSQATNATGYESWHMKTGVNL